MCFSLYSILLDSMLDYEQPIQSSAAWTCPSHWAGFSLNRKIKHLPWGFRHSFWFLYLISIAKNCENCPASPVQASNTESEQTGSRLRQHPDSCAWWFFFFLWQKFASGQEGHWSCLKEVSELYELADSCLTSMTHLLIRFGGGQKNTHIAKRLCCPGHLEGRKACLVLILHNFWK